MKLLLASLFSLGLVLVVKGSQLRGFHLETFRHSPDGQHLLLRTKRGAQTELCKYKKGDWSQCDSLLMVKSQSYRKLLFASSSTLNWRGEREILFQSFVLTLVVNPASSGLDCL